MLRKDFKEVPWSEVNCGDKVWIAGNIKNDKVIIVYGPHEVYDPIDNLLKSGNTGNLFYERWPYLYIEKKEE